MNRQTAVAQVPFQSLHRSPDDIVLASMPLREGTDRSRLSRFGDNCWDMAPAIFQTRARHRYGTLDFTDIDCPIENLTAKEYIHALLNERLPDGRVRLHPGLARTTLRHLRRFMAFVRGRLGRFDAVLIDQDLIDAYRVALTGESSAAPREMTRHLKPIVDLHRLAPWLTCGGLGFLPWGGRTLTRVVGCGPKGEENRTPRIPEPVIGALIHWSLKYLDLFSADILAARAELTSLQRRRAERPPRRRTTDVLERVGAWIDARRRSGRGIPVWEQPSKIGGKAPVLARATDMCGEVINMQLVVLQTGLNMQTIQENAGASRLIRKAVAELGIERGGMDTPITIDPDTGRPWRGRFDQLSLVEEEKHLQTAAYVLCAYLTGMRDGEVQAMRPGCVARSLSADGMIERLAVQSTIYKHRGTRGELAEWITIEPVDRAVAMAERLAAQHRRRRDEDLWLVLDHRSTAAGRGIPDIVRQINRFRASIDERYGMAGEPAIPHVEGHEWWFTPRQFRRTLAWYIANRPFGVVAGKIQYKHASVAMFDGYAGTSASGFRQEVEQERALGQLEDVVAQYEAHRSGQRLAGPAASRLAAEYERVERELKPFPGRIGDKGRLRAMLVHLARTLHVGHLSDCFFEPATALCLDKAGKGERAAPALSRCAPDRCPNACLTARHLPVWEASIAEAEELLRDKRLPRLQREVLQRDNERKRRLIAPLKAGAAS
jgi:integrase